MHVCMVTKHSCIRVFKIGYALAQRGHTVDLITNATTFGYNVFNSMYVYNDAEMMRREVEQAAKDVDLFHVHNEPDWLVPAVRAMTDKPIIYDIHDLESLRWQREPDEDETAAFDMSDGWVHVSDACRIAAEKYHGNGKPSATVPSLVNKEFFYPNPGSVSWDALCYEGGLSSEDNIGTSAGRWNAGQSGNGKQPTNFRNYLEAVKAFAMEGYNVQLFTMVDVNTHAYAAAGGVVINQLPYSLMLMAIRPFAFGLVGAVADYPLMQAALPNKLFEYMSQGVVPVCYNADAAGDFVEELGIGIKLNSLNNLREQLSDGPTCRDRLLATQYDWTMEKHIGQVEELYKAVL